MLSLLVTFLILTNLVSGYVIWNMLRKQEILEEYVVSMFVQAQRALAEMRALDEMQMFEKDDDVGRIFVRLIEIVEDYAKFLGIEETKGTNEEKQK